MDWTGATNTPTFIKTSNLAVYGNITFITAMSIPTAAGSRLFIYGTCAFKSGGSSAGASIGWNIYITGTMTLQQYANITGYVEIAAGTLDTNNYNLRIGGYMKSSGTTPGTLTLGSSIIECIGDWDLSYYPPTIAAGTSRIILWGGQFKGGSKVYYDLDIQGGTITGSNTFHDLYLRDLTYVANGTTQTLTTLSGNGIPGNLVGLLAVTPYSTPFIISIASGTIIKYFFALEGCTATGGATFTAIESSNVEGNTGWNFYDADTVVSYPSIETVIINEDVTFTWDVDPGVQTHYDLDYSTNGIVWTNYANKVESAVASCVITAGTLSSRIYYWRVRVYFYAGAYVSEYSQTSFIAAINPVTSAVDCDLMPMPTVTWTASEQQAFQLKVGAYDTGTIYSALGTHTILQYFDDGAYGIQVRTQNSLGIWSDYTAIAYFEIANVPGDAITLTAEQSGNTINLIWETTGTYEKYYIYRDDVPIADVTDTAYADNFAFGTSTYKVRGIMADDYYTMSNEVEQTLTLANDAISLVSPISWINLKYALNGPIKHTYNDSDSVSYLNFEGRVYPVSAHSNFSNRQASYNYAFLTLVEVKTITALKGKTVIFKDVKGNRIIGIANNFNYQTGRKYHQVSFNITQTDYDEAVEYA